MLWQGMSLQSEKAFNQPCHMMPLEFCFKTLGVIMRALGTHRHALILTVLYLIFPAFSGQNRVGKEEIKQYRG